MPSPNEPPPTSNAGSAWSGYSTGWSYLATMMSGLIVWGGLGFLADRALDLRWLFLPIGILLGLGGGIYLAQRRYGGGWKA